MNHISILIVDDDLNKISSIIKTIKEVFTETLSITQAICVQEAIENLQKKEFHLLITDLQMPLKYDDAPNNNGGKSLIKELYKKRNNINVPMYIVGLTQFEELKNTFEGVWKIWHFDPSSEIWKINLRDLIHHISLVKGRVKTDKVKTIFVEGPTDKKIIENGFKHFFEQHSDRVYIDTINYGGGATWVERQLFIWAKSLTINSAEGNYLKAVGIFDDDAAGRLGIENIEKKIDSNSAEYKTFSIIKISYKYSVLLKSIKSKGITFPTTIEDLLSIECWKLASDKGWLEKRDLREITINKIILSLKKEDLNNESLRENHFSENEILQITSKVKDVNKKQFCNMVCELEKGVLMSINYLLKDVLKKLKISTIAQ
jgi:CheY-like chemotaxis protein